MKLIIIVISITVAGTAGALAMPISGTWARPLNESPEGVAIGATLLSVAALLRSRFSRHAK
jgi:uncharacterized membrane protein YadS